MVVFGVVYCLVKVVLCGFFVDFGVVCFVIVVYYVYYGFFVVYELMYYGVD